MVHQTAPDAVMVAINDLEGNVEALHDSAWRRPR
jgi:hypothetical protein